MDEKFSYRARSYSYPHLTSKGNRTKTYGSYRRLRMIARRRVRDICAYKYHRLMEYRRPKVKAYKEKENKNETYGRYRRFRMITSRRMCYIGSYKYDGLPEYRRPATTVEAPHKYTRASSYVRKNIIKSQLFL